MLDDGGDDDDSGIDWMAVLLMVLVIEVIMTLHVTHDHHH